MVLMSGSKKARHSASITNRTSVFGIMGGIAPTVGVDSSVRTALKYRATTQPIVSFSMAPNAARTALRAANALSVNPQCSGGVGKKSLSCAFVVK